MARRIFGGSAHATPRELSPLLAPRLPFAVGAVVACALLILLRLWYLQIIEGAEMRSLSEHNRIRLRRVPAERGIIYDRNGVILADNRPSFDVTLVPEDAGDVPAVLGRLRSYLGDGLPSELSQARRPAPYQPIVLLRDVSWPEVATIDTRQLELPGVTLEVASRRLYPFGPLAAHLLGYVGEATPADLEKRPDLYMGDVIGKSGIERPFDRELRGVGGREEIEVDAVGRRMRVLDEEPETPGRNLTLTIDYELQAAAEGALEGYRGAIVALDPDTGEVLALASRPTFDPNEFAAGIAPAAWRALVTDRYRPLTNRATQGQYPPASTFKIVVGLAGLEERAVGPSDDACCWGGMRFGGRVFRCWRREGHGCLAFNLGLVQSCDVYFYEVGNRLGVDAIADYARRLGLGEPTGVGVGAEERGLVPDSEWKQRRFGERWYPGETLSVAIGQGYVLATPIQMAGLIATVANGGTRYRPFVVKRIEGGDEPSITFEPQVVARLDVRPATLTYMQDALRDVVMSDRGTGKRARIEGIEVAGKTGTAQAAGAATSGGGGERSPELLRDHAWFVGYAPADRPTIAVAVLVEHAGHHGGTVAAPMARAVMERHLAQSMAGSTSHDEIRQTAHRQL
jgi:penicillin-binding protein 2